LADAAGIIACTLKHTTLRRAATERRFPSAEEYIFGEMVSKTTPPFMFMTQAASDTLTGTNCCFFCDENNFIVPLNHLAESMQNFHALLVQISNFHWILSCKKMLQSNL
jgi:hypothetical protein